MGKTKDVFQGIGHTFGGMGMALPFIGLCLLFKAPTYVAFVSIPLIGVFGFWREWKQHRTDKPVWNQHRIIEASEWPLGAVIACVVWLFVS